MLFAGCSLPSSKSLDPSPPCALPLCAPQPAPRNSCHLDGEGRKLWLLVSGRDLGSDLYAWVYGSDLEIVLAFRETTPYLWECVV